MDVPNDECEEEMMEDIPSDEEGPSQDDNDTKVFQRLLKDEAERKKAAMEEIKGIATRNKLRES